MLTHQQRDAIAGQWLGELLRRKATPKRLSDEEAQAAEMLAMRRRIVRELPADAHADLIRHWLERVADRVDDRQPVWPSIPDLTADLRMVLPERKAEAPEAKRDDAGDRGQAMGQNWLRSADGRRACVEGWHVAGAQWVRRELRFPTVDECRAIKAVAEDVTERVEELAHGSSFGSLTVALLGSAVAIERRRLSVYAQLQEHHRLPDRPEWAVDGLDELDAKLRGMREIGRAKDAKRDASVAKRQAEVAA